MLNLLDKSKLSFRFATVGLFVCSSSLSWLLLSLRIEGVFFNEESCFVRFFVTGVCGMGDIERFRLLVSREEFDLADSAIGWVPDRRLRRDLGVTGSEVKDFLLIERRGVVVSVSGLQRKESILNRTVRKR